MPSTLRVGRFALRFEVVSPGLRGVLDRLVSTKAGDTRGPVLSRIELVAVRREARQRRGLVVRGTFGEGVWQAQYAGRYLRWKARGRGLEQVRVGLALTGEEAEDGYCMRSFIRFFLAELLARNGGVALHAGAVARPEGAVVFMARSGGGKTTLVRTFGRGRGLGDDFVLIVPEGGGFRVVPSPVAGREGTPIEGEASPLWRLCEMVKGEDTQVEPMPDSEQVAAIMRHAVLFTGDLVARRTLLDTVLRLAQSVGVLRLTQSLAVPPWEALKDA